MHTISSELRERFARANRVLVLTGAGVSAESGVPTFRGGGNTAVWKGMPFDVISSATMVERDLPAVWEWFDYRRDVLANLTPNAAHQQIARWQDQFAEFTLVTQNVDGLHQKAGSRDVVDENESYDDSYWYVQLVSSPSRKVYLSLTYRDRTRDYTTREATSSKFGVEESRGQWSGSASYRVTDRVAYILYYSQEDTDSSRPNRDFDTDFLLLAVSVGF